MIQTRVCEALRGGATFKRAAQLAGIGHSTMRLWRAYGQTPGKPKIYVDFFEAVEEAREAWVDERLQNIRKAATIPNAKTGQVDWKADAWLLEKMERQRFGRVNILEHAGEIRTSAAPMLDLRGLSDVQLDQLESILEIAAKTSEARKGTVPEAPPPMEDRH